MTRKSYAQDISERLLNSPDPEERKNVFLGFDPARGRTPILYVDSWWKEGLWVLGAARIGKTSRALTPLAAQRIRRNDCPVFIVDLKGDEDFFHTIRQETLRLQRRFLFFSNVDYRSTYLFNPLAQSTLQTLTLPQLAEVLVNAMGLWYGFIYGGAYFAFQAISALGDALNLKAVETHNGWSFVRQPGGLRPAATFKHLEQNVRDVVKSKKEYSEAAALVMSLRKLASMLQLNFESGTDSQAIPLTATDAAIHVPTSLFPDTNGQYPVTYLFLRAGAGIVESSLVAKMFIYTLYNAMQLIRDAHRAGQLAGDPPVAPLFIDEYQHLADDASKQILTQGATVGLQFVLANQDVSQLRAANLFDTTWENSGTRLIFSARLEEMQTLLMKLSGEKRIDYIKAYEQADLTRGLGPQFADQGFTMTAMPGPRFERNDIITTSARPGHAFFFPGTDDRHGDYNGYPLHVVCPHWFGPKTHRFIQSQPWPEKTPETIVPAELRGGNLDPFSFIPEHCRV